jgi:hypothetical protein
MSVLTALSKVMASVFFAVETMFLVDNPIVGTPLAASASPIDALQRSRRRSKRRPYVRCNED